MGIFCDWHYVLYTHPIDGLTGGGGGGGGGYPPPPPPPTPDASYNPLEKIPTPLPVRVAFFIMK